jgi:hypothetical protein
MFNRLMPDLNTHSDVQRSRYVYGMFGITINYTCKTYGTKGLTDKTQQYSLHNVVA